MYPDPEIRSRTLVDAARSSQPPLHAPPPPPERILTVETATHWLVTVARSLGLQGIDALPDLDGAKTADVWARVTEASGLSDAELLSRLADRYVMRVADLGGAEQHATRLVPAIVAVRYNVLPLRYTDRTLDVATADPHDV